MWLLVVQALCSWSRGLSWGIILCFFFFFFFNDPAPTEIYSLSLYDALPICPAPFFRRNRNPLAPRTAKVDCGRHCFGRSEEHTSELQSLRHLVCRLLLE